MSNWTVKGSFTPIYAPLKGTAPVTAFVPFFLRVYIQYIIIIDVILFLLCVISLPIKLKLL